LYSVQQQLIADRLAELTSEVNLFKAMGGGWQEAVSTEQGGATPPAEG